MQHTVMQRKRLPFKTSALVVSLCGASILLALDVYLYYIDYISAEVAMWAATGIFVVAASYESFLLSLVAKFMFKSLKKDDRDDN